MKIFKYRIINHILFWIFIYVFYTMPFILTGGISSDVFINLIYLPIDFLTVYFVISFLMPRFLFHTMSNITFSRPSDSGSLHAP